MRLNLVRILFILAAACLGLFVALSLDQGRSVPAFAGALAGAAIAAGVAAAERSVGRKAFVRLASGAAGLSVGLVVANLAACPLYALGPELGTPLAVAVPLGLNLVLGYAGLALGLRGSKQFSALIGREAMDGLAGGLKLLDTSVIIDGRIVDICGTGFLRGELLVPRFVLRELQAIADSSDTARRRRGRRGLDVLQRLQKSEHVTVSIDDRDFKDVREVDAKLVKLARVLGAAIITNDYSLNRVAEVEEVEVLNVNELTNSLRPVVLAGEVMGVRLTKEGKEPEQGVGYMDDGTMVVVENGKRLMGRMVQVMVTSVLQTSAGRMIFGRPEGSGRS